MNILNITSFSLSYYFAMLNLTKNIRIKFITDTGGYMNTTVRYLWTLHSIYTSTKLYISRHIVVKQKHILQWFETYKNRYIQPTKILLSIKIELHLIRLLNKVWKKLKYKNKKNATDIYISLHTYTWSIKNTATLFVKTLGLCYTLSVLIKKRCNPFLNFYTLA